MRRRIVVAVWIWHYVNAMVLMRIYSSPASSQGLIMFPKFKFFICDS